MVMKSAVAYVIQCAGDYFYVGITDNIQQTWVNHVEGCESEWTYIHKPLAIVLTINDAEGYDEFSLIKVYMAKYGVHKVRGGNYSKTILSDSQIALLQSAIRQDKDRQMNQLAEMCTGLSL